MKAIAAIQIDLEVTPLGTRSRLADELLGVSVLRRTIERVVRAQRVEGVFVLCPVEQRDRCEALLHGTRAKVQPFNAEPPPWRKLVQAARKWSLDSWRGGISGTTCFDEYTDGCILAELLESTRADAILSVAPGAVVFDPDLADRMIAHGEATREDSRLTFAQTPPGLSGLLINAELVGELARQRIPIGWVFNYKPDGPLKDLVFQPCFYEVPPEVRYATGRLVADTDRAWARLERLLTAYADPDARTTGRWLIEREASEVPPLPHEVELEITTDDPYPDALLRPRGERLERTGALDPGVVERVAAELARFDDSLLVLGGFGDPLRHPQFTQMLKACRSVSRGASSTDRESAQAEACGSGVYGLCVRTTAVDLDDAGIEALIEHEVDVLSITLDAWTPELYGQVQTPHRPDAASLDAVLRNLDRLTEARVARQSVTPIVVPEFAKARENVHELDDFHDGWLRKLGAVCITGVGSYADQLDDHGVMSMAPPRRSACRRIWSRCVVLSDGRVAMCDQDFKGLHTIDNLGESSLEELWNDARLADLRGAHAGGAYESNALCASCDEWHRP